MSSKKRSKANKLAGLTEEERLRYLHHRAVMEEEAQHRKQQLIAGFLSNKMKQEESFSRLNLPKINQRWRNILREIKRKELKNDIKDLKNRFEVILQRKTNIINNLLSDFQDAEAQYSMEFQKHIQMISKFIELHNIRLINLRDWYMGQLNAVMDKRNADLNEMVDEIERDKIVLKSSYDDSIGQLEIQIQRLGNHFQGNENALTNKLLQKIKEFESSHGLKLVKLQEEYRNLLLNYKEKNEQKISNYLKLRKQDEENLANINENELIISKYENNMQKIKKECLNSETKFEKEREELQMKYEGLTDKFNKLTHQLEENKVLDREQLKVLSAVSNDVIKKLIGTLKKGEQIVKIIKNCHKTMNANPFKMSDEEKNSKIITNEEIPIPYDKLETLWIKYNDIYLENENLKNEKKLALIKNQKLQKKLRSGLKSIQKLPTVPHKHITRFNCPPSEVLKLISNAKIM